MRHIAHLSFSGAFGGREKVAFSLVEALSSHIDASLYLVVEERTGVEGASALMEHLSNYQVRVKQFATDKLFSPSTLKELAHKMNEDGIEIVHCHCHKSMFYALLLKHILNLKIVTAVTLHGLVLPFSLKSVLHHTLNMLGIIFSDGIIGCSKEIVTKFQKIPMLARKVSIIRNNLSLTSVLAENKEYARKEMRKLYDIPQHKTIWIGNASRLTRQKNIPLYLESVRKVIDHYKRDDLLFVIAGNGELEDELRKQAELLQLDDSFLFTGFLTRMPFFYSAIDIFVLSSDWEGTPMALLEAMAYGIPVVAPQVGGVPDVVEEGLTGITFPRRDLASFTKALIDLIGDPPRAERMGQAGKRRISEEFSARRWVEEHLRFYELLLRKAVHTR